MILRNTAGQSQEFGSLVKRTDGTRLLAGATARVGKDGVWDDGENLPVLDETDQWNYSPTQAETDCEILAITVDHADAVHPLMFVCRTLLADPSEVLAEVNSKLNENFQVFVSSNPLGKSIDDITTPKVININVDD